MKTLKHALLLATLMPCIAVAEESTAPEGETTVTQVLNGLDSPAMIYNTASSSVFIIQQDKPTQYYNKTESGQLINVTPIEDSPSK